MISLPPVRVLLKNLYILPLQLYNMIKDNTTKQAFIQDKMVWDEFITDLSTLLNEHMADRYGDTFYGPVTFEDSVDYNVPPSFDNVSTIGANLVNANIINVNAINGPASPNILIVSGQFGFTGAVGFFQGATLQLPVFAGEPPFSVTGQIWVNAFTHELRVNVSGVVYSIALQTP